jgi:hypothetical protein
MILAREINFQTKNNTHRKILSIVNHFFHKPSLLQCASCLNQDSLAFIAKFFLVIEAVFTLRIAHQASFFGAVRLP